MWLLDKLLRREMSLFEEWCEGREVFLYRLHSKKDCLTWDQFLAEGGERSGRAWWWLRETNGEFVPLELPLELPRGYQPVDQQIRLPAGSYLLGVGRDVRRIRVPFVVRKEGRK